jgi:hypothetical protein
LEIPQILATFLPMKSLCFLLFVAFIVTGRAASPDETSGAVTKILDDANTKLQSDLRQAAREYRTVIANQLRFADAIEVSVLAPATIKIRDGDESVDFTGDGDGKRKVLRRAKVPEAEIAVWCAALSKILTTDSPPAPGSPAPTHWINVTSNGSPLFAEAICLDRGAYFFSNEETYKVAPLVADFAAMEKLISQLLPAKNRNPKLKTGGK